MTECKNPMETAPRNGKVIIVGDPDCGEFPMSWQKDFKNALIPDTTGFWVTPGGHITWDESRGGH